MRNWHFLLPFLLLPCAAAAQTPGTPPVWWRSSGSIEMNFNPATSLPDSTVPVFAVANTGSESDMIVVYETADSATENGLWQIEDSLGVRIGLTTQRILGGGCDIRYGDANMRGGMINYLAHSWDAAPAGDTLLLTVGKADILRLNGNVAEAVYFGRRLDAPRMTQWLSYLAVKYGITLWQTDYRDSRGRCVWSYSDAPDMSDFIAGVGRDDHFGLLQARSWFFNRKVLISVHDAGGMEDGEFILFGRDSLPLTATTGAIVYDDTLWELSGLTRVQVTGGDIRQYGTRLAFNDTLWGGDSLTTIMFIDRSGTGEFSTVERVSPAASDGSGRIRFDGLHWDTDGNGTDMFCLARVAPNQPRNTSLLAADSPPELAGFQDEPQDCFGKQWSGEGGNRGIGGPEYSLHPNPNRGDFTLEINYPESVPVSVSAYTQDGKLVRTWEYGGGTSHRIDGQIGAPGYYLLEIRSPLGHKTIQMVVN